MSEEKKQLRIKLKEAIDLLKTAKSKEEQIALINYTGALYSILQEENHQYEKAIDKYYPNYSKYAEDAEKAVQKHFIEEKDFHLRYTDEILYLTSKESEALHHIPTDSFMKPISKKASRDILNSFLEKYEIIDFYEQLYKRRNIHSMNKIADRYTTGLALYNPLCQETDLFIRKEKNSLHDLEVIIHELGHAFDEAYNTPSCEEYNSILHMSYYTEVVSALLERLFLRYLINENIEKEQAQQLLLRFEKENFLILLGSNAWGLFDDKFILNNRFQHCSNKTIIKKLQPYFNNPKRLMSVINDMRNYDFTEIHQYAYGNILSLIMSDEIEADGLLNERLEYFLQHRKPLVLEELLRNDDFHPKIYAKNYKKETNLIKK